MGVQIIEQPRNETEEWLVNTVKRQAEAAKIGDARGRHLRLAGAERLRDRREP
jgi:hypothetical protein